MCTLHEMKRRVEAIDLQKIGAGIVADSKPELISKNKEQLMDEGVNRLGAKLRRYQSNSYAARKHKLNPFPGFGNPDLYRTGAFQGGFKLKLIGSNAFEIYSTDSKAKMLSDKYGGDIYGLTEESKIEYRKEGMRPRVVIEVKKVLKVQ
jgi:hypothetical protein